MTYRILPLVLVAMALALLVSGPALAQQDLGKNRDFHEGTVVSVTGNKLIMKGLHDTSEHTMTLAPDARVMCDGKECKLDDLKPGQKIRVKTQPDNKQTAVRIEALDKNAAFDRAGGGGR
jgi:hypothetical protein